MHTLITQSHISAELNTHPSDAVITKSFSKLYQLFSKQDATGRSCSALQQVRGWHLVAEASRGKARESATPANVLPVDSRPPDSGGYRPGISRAVETLDEARTHQPTAQSICRLWERRQHFNITPLFDLLCSGKKTSLHPQHKPV